MLKKSIFDIFKCCTASTRAAWHYTCSWQCFLTLSMTHQTVKAYKSHFRQNTILCPNFQKAQFLFFFTFSTVNIKQVQVVCHIVINETHGRLMNYYQTLTENCGICWSSYVPTYSSVSAFNGPSKTRFLPVYFQPMYQIFIWPLVMYVCMFL